MKTTMKLLGIIALVAVIGFSFTACDDGSGNGGGGGTRDPVTYTGTANSVTYTLKIEDGGARAVLTPTQGDRYTLTASGKTSTGTVSAFVGGVLTLTPSTQGVQPFFTATVSGTSITAMTGSITWDNGTSENAPSTFTSGNPGGGLPNTGPGTGGDPTLPNGYIWVDDERTNQGILFEGSNYCHYYLAGGTWGSRSVEGTWTGNTITITGGLSTITATFTVSGDRLAEYSGTTRVATYTKTAGTIQGQSSSGGGGSFVGTWIGGQGNTGRFVINDDDTWSIGTEAPIVGFVSQYSGTYTVSGGTATFTGTGVNGMPITGTNTATVNGNTLTLNAGGSLMTSMGATWTRQQ